MTIGELIEALEVYPRGREVILSEDGEGNGFHLLARMTAQLYCPRTGEVWAWGDVDEIGEEPRQNVVVLWPS